MIVSHELVVDEDHVHPACVVTEAVPVRPLDGTVRLPGATTKVHGADCVIVTVCPATVSVAVRADAVVLTLTLMLIVPLPLPLAPMMIAAHDALLDAVHAQPEPAVTATLKAPPLEVSVCDAGDSAYVHPEVPVCVTVKVLPAIVSVPVRDVAVVRAVAANATEPLPEPLAPLVTVSQELLLLVAVQVQLAPAVTATLPVPAAAGSVWEVGERVKAQGVAPA